MRTSIHPTAVIEEGATLSDGVQVGPFCHIGPEVTLGDGVRLHSHVVISGKTTIGSGCEIHSFAALGTAPEHVAYEGQNTQLIIGKNNRFREHSTVNIGTAEGRGETRIGDNGYFMTATHVAHDCIIGDNTIFANSAIVAGHVVVEDFAFLGGACAVHQHCQIGAHAFLGGGAIVVHDIIPYGSATGNFAMLEGLNIIGLRRRGFDRDKIDQLRAAFKDIFCGDRPFQDRLLSAERQYEKSAEAKNILEFINRDRARPIMMAR